MDRKSDREKIINESYRKRAENKKESWGMSILTDLKNDQWQSKIAATRPEGNQRKDHREKNGYL